MKYFLSSRVKIFPSSYRGQYEQTATSSSSGSTGNVYTPFDPESMMLSEYNWVNVGNNNNAKNTNGYIVEFNPDDTTKLGTLKVVIGGYYFEIYETSLDELGENCYFGIKLTTFTLNHVVGDDVETLDSERKTSVLTIIGEAGDDTDETTALKLDKEINGKYYFVGLMCGSDTNDIQPTYSLQITDEDGNICQNSFLPEIVHGSTAHSIRTCSTKNDGTTDRPQLIIETPVCISDIADTEDEKYPALDIAGGVEIEKNIFAGTATLDNTIIGKTNAITGTNNNITGINNINGTNNLTGNLTIGTNNTADITTSYQKTTLNNKLTITDTTAAISKGTNAAFELYGGLHIKDKNIVIDSPSTAARPMATALTGDGMYIWNTGTDGRTYLYGKSSLDWANTVLANDYDDAIIFLGFDSTYTADTPDEDGYEEFRATLGTSGNFAASEKTAISYVSTTSKVISSGVSSLNINVDNISIGTDNNSQTNLYIKNSSDKNTIRLIGNNDVGRLILGNEKTGINGLITIYDGITNVSAIELNGNEYDDDNAIAKITVGNNTRSGYISVVSKTGSNNITLNGITGEVEASSYNATSDRRLKENIASYTPKKSILDLDIKKYDFINGKKNQIGCIAQDLQEICPEIVDENSDGYLSIQESKIVYLLLDEVKKLRKEIDLLKKEK